MSDFGINADEVQSLKREGLLSTLEALLNGRPVKQALLANAMPNNARLLRALSLWLRGNEHLARRQPAAALELFAAAASQAR